MAHNLNYNEKLQRHSFVSAKELPWHGLGKIVDHAMTSDEAIKESGLDYTVKKVPNHAAIPLNFDVKDSVVEHVVNPKSFSTVRTDTREIIGTVGADYNIIQNVDAFKFFDDITRAKEAMFQTAGALNNGDIIFISAKLPSYISVRGVDIIEQYLLLFNAHNGSKSIEVMFTPTRVVCNNTLTYAMQKAKIKYRIRHTKSASNKLDEAKKVLHIQNKLTNDIGDLYDLMAKTKFADNLVDKFVCKLFANDVEFNRMLKGESAKLVLSAKKFNMVNDIYRYYFTGVGQDLDTTKGTVWGAYNAVTGYFQNSKAYKNSSHKMLSITDGDVLTKSLNAFGLAKELSTSHSSLQAFIDA
jgi:phage/plasmid-like protein (TIGR03299 family)